jgi:isocitrate dehydrogenase (NAD+)
MGSHKVSLIPGDWIGPETCKVLRRIVEAAGVQIDWDVQKVEGGVLSDALVASCRENRVILKGKLAAPRVVGQLPPTIELRRRLGLWATLRPVRELPGIPTRFPGMDLVVIRETSEDIYSGLEHKVADGVFEAIKITTPAACERIARFAFEYAAEHGRKSVTIAHKSNIMKKSDGLFLRTARRIGEEYADRVETRDVIVDALCMHLVRNPLRFDVLLTGNLFGDIVSDLCSGLGGGISTSPSLSRSEEIFLFENPHGKAPDLVGTGLANPLPMIQAAIPMLCHLGEDAAARNIRAAMEGALRGGLSPVDQGGSDGCAAFETAILARL